MDSAVTRQRRHRATVAEVLLRVHQSSGLESPEQWDWEALAIIPQWCLLEPQEREHLQAVCGALVLGPGLLRWVHGCALRSAGDLIGLRLFLAIQDQLQKLQLDTPVPVTHDAAAPETAEQARDHLLAEGAAVLFATLPEQFATEPMIASLGDRRGNVRPDTAAVLLGQAQEMILRHPEPQPQKQPEQPA